MKFHTKKKKRDFSQIFGFVAVINLFRWCFVLLFSPKRREKQKQKKKTKKKRDRRGREEEPLCSHGEREREREREREPSCFCRSRREKEGNEQQRVVLFFPPPREIILKTHHPVTNQMEGWMRGKENTAVPGHFYYAAGQQPPHLHRNIPSLASPAGRS